MNEPDFDRLLEDLGDLRRFRTFCEQPAWAGRPRRDQLHRWLRAVSGRSQCYAELVIRLAPKDQLPPALVGVIAQL